ncbi:unnamed protein product [Allacma fusca]|uniref:Uncharacterized protein n=1 Tax=Allacma fusca TaxID=39272 RepID=A0A8J2KFF2_9HEXA|nr:unnamed protein product [Allacma fusca]
MYVQLLFFEKVSHTVKDGVKNLGNSKTRNDFEAEIKILFKTLRELQLSIQNFNQLQRSIFCF